MVSKGPGESQVHSTTAAREPATWASTVSGLPRAAWKKVRAKSTTAVAAAQTPVRVSTARTTSSSASRPVVMCRTTAAVPCRSSPSPLSTSCPAVRNSPAREARLSTTAQRAAISSSCARLIGKGHPPFSSLVRRAGHPPRAIVEKNCTDYTDSETIAPDHPPKRITDALVRSNRHRGDRDVHPRPAGEHGHRPSSCRE